MIIAVENEPGSFITRGGRGVFHRHQRMRGAAGVVHAHGAPAGHVVAITKLVQTQNKTPPKTQTTDGYACALHHVRTREITTPLTPTHTTSHHSIHRNAL